VGYDSAEVVGRHMSEFVHPDDLPLVQADFLRSLSGGGDS